MTTAGRPSVTDNARAEAWRRYQGDWDSYHGEPVDDWGFSEAERRAFMAGAEWAAGRAETTTATTEDIHALDARWFERWETEQPLADKHAGYYQGRVSAIAQCREELLGLLATARTRPTRDDLILALAQADGQAWPDGMDDHTANHMYGKQADAVLALLADQPDPAETRARVCEELADAPTYARQPAVLRARAHRYRGGSDRG